MKRIVLYVCVMLMLLTSCSKKMHPETISSSKRKNVPTPVHTNVEPITPLPGSPVKAPSSSIAFPDPMIVIDETGKIITSRDKLPAEIGSKVDYAKITRSFTPAQRQNLIYRFKMVPPRVLFVPEHFISKSARGYYIIYKKKFWYWKKEDGLFYLDETYYQ